MERRLAILRRHQLRRKHDLPSQRSFYTRGRKRTSSISSERIAAFALTPVGRLHSWSDATVCEDVLLDLRHLDSIVVHADNSSPFVEAGAGCQIKRLLRNLQKSKHTLPSLGLIDEQTVAGAIATGTHGSGRNSLSHYVQAVCVACYNPQTGEPMIREITSGTNSERRVARSAVSAS